MPHMCVERVAGEETLGLFASTCIPTMSEVRAQTLPKLYLVVHYSTSAFRGVLGSASWESLRKLDAMPAAHVAWADKQKGSMRSVAALAYAKHWGKLGEVESQAEKQPHVLSISNTSLKLKLSL